MGRMIQSGDDVVAFLKEQHQQIQALFEAVSSTTGTDRASSFYALRRLLAVHETAEEEIVHPIARRELANGEAIVKARLEEEKAAKQALMELEGLDVDSTDFEDRFEALKQDVVAHAESEEQEEFTQLGRKLEPKRLTQMRKAAELAESVAPTRPHAGVESPVANILVGPFAAMVDRVHDALTGKS